MVKSDCMPALRIGRGAVQRPVIAALLRHQVPEEVVLHVLARERQQPHAARREHDVGQRRAEVADDVGGTAEQRDLGCEIQFPGIDDDEAQRLQPADDLHLVPQHAARVAAAADIQASRSRRPRHTRAQRLEEADHPGRLDVGLLGERRGHDQLVIGRRLVGNRRHLVRSHAQQRQRVAVDLPDPSAPAGDQDTAGREIDALRNHAESGQRLDQPMPVIAVPHLLQQHRAAGLARQRPGRYGHLQHAGGKAAERREGLRLVGVDEGLADDRPRRRHDHARPGHGGPVQGEHQCRRRLHERPRSLPVVPGRKVRRCPQDAGRPPAVTSSILERRHAATRLTRRHDPSSRHAGTVGSRTAVGQPTLSAVTDLIPRPASAARSTPANPSARASDVRNSTNRSRTAFAARRLPSRGPPPANRPGSATMTGSAASASRASSASSSGPGSAGGHRQAQGPPGRVPRGPAAPARARPGTDPPAGREARVGRRRRPPR